MDNDTSKGAQTVESDRSGGEEQEGGGQVARRRPRRRTFYSIGEVCEMMGIKPHVLRYWESRIPELAPTKNRAGNRVYQAREIELIALIHRLVQDERYTVDGARKQLADMRGEGRAREESARALQRIFLRGLQVDLQELYDFLDPRIVEKPKG